MAARGRLRVELGGSTEEVDVLVDGVALDGGEAQLLDELLLEVLDVNGAGTD